jgi:hypothetical protein
MTKTLMSSKDVTGVDITGVVVFIIAKAALSMMTRIPKSLKDDTGVDAGLVAVTTVATGVLTTVGIKTPSRDQIKKKNEFRPNCLH